MVRSLSKIDEYDDYLFIVLHFPVFDRAVGRLNAGELDIFVGPDYLVTIPNQPLQPVEYLFERCRQKEELREQHFSKGSGFLLYRIVDDGFDYCFPMLRKIGNKLDAVEDETGHVGVTVVEAIGHGRQRGITHEHRGRVFESRFLPKALLTFVVADELAAGVVAAIADAARSGGESGDGIVWASPVVHVTHNRTGRSLEEVEVA